MLIKNTFALLVFTVATLFSTAHAAEEIMLTSSSDIDDLQSLKVVRNELVKAVKSSCKSDELESREQMLDCMCKNAQIEVVKLKNTYNSIVTQKHQSWHGKLVKYSKGNVFGALNLNLVDKQILQCEK